MPTVVYNPSDPTPFDLYNAQPTYDADFTTNVYGSWQYVVNGDDYPTFGVTIEVAYATPYAVPGWRVQGVPITVTLKAVLSGDVSLDVLPATSSESDADGRGTIAFALSGTGGDCQINVRTGNYDMYFVVHLMAVGETAPDPGPPVPPPDATPDPDAPGGPGAATARGNIDYDQLRVAARRGFGDRVQMAAGNFVPGHVLVFDPWGSAVDGGAGGSGHGGSGGGTGDVSSTLLISTTTPLTGGGDLSTDRTLGISTFVGDSGSGGERGAVPAPEASDGATKFLKADGTWAVPPGSGEQGIQGEKGDTGDTGPQGIQGIQGDQGEQGIQGVPGEDGAGTGTVTSVDLRMPPDFTVTFNPVTAAGTLTVDINDQAPHAVYIGPRSGSDGAPEFRQLEAADIPTELGTSIQLGGSSPSFPQLLRTGTKIEVKLADNSAYAGLVASSLIATTTIAGRLVFAAKTANYTLVSPNDVLGVFSNAGATGAVQFLLPTAVAGMQFTFIVEVAQTLTVKAGASTTIRSAASVSASAGTAAAATVGNTITMVATSTTKWVVISIVGTWTIT